MIPNWITNGFLCHIYIIYRERGREKERERDKPIDISNILQLKKLHKLFGKQVSKSNDEEYYL